MKSECPALYALGETPGVFGAVALERARREDLDRLLQDLSWVGFGVYQQAYTLPFGQLQLLRVIYNSNRCFL